VRRFYVISVSSCLYDCLFGLVHDLSRLLSYPNVGFHIDLLIASHIDYVTQVSLGFMQVPVCFV